MQIVLSISAGVFYGGADFFGGLASRRITAFVATILSQGVGLLLLLVPAVIVPQRLAIADGASGAVAGIATACALLLLYRALAVGKMGTVSPITATLTAAVPVLVSMFFGEHLHVIQWVGIAFAFVAIIFIAASFSETKGTFASRGLFEAIGAGILIGCVFVLFSRRHPSEAIDTLLAARVASIATLGIFALILRPPMDVDSRGVAAGAVSGALDTLGNLFYMWATFRGGLAIAAVLASLYPGSTVFLASVVLRERLSKLQWLGVGFAFASIGFITASR